MYSIAWTKVGRAGHFPISYGLDFGFGPRNKRSCKLYNKNFWIHKINLFFFLDMFWMEFRQKCGKHFHIGTLWKYSPKTLGSLFLLFNYFSQKLIKNLLVFVSFLGKNPQSRSHIYRKQRYLHLYCKNKVFSTREHG